MRYLRYLALPGFCYRYKLLQYKIKVDLLSANSIDLFSQSLALVWNLKIVHVISGPLTELIWTFWWVPHLLLNDKLGELQLVVPTDLSLDASLALGQDQTGAYRHFRSLATAWPCLAWVCCNWNLDLCSWLLRSLSVEFDRSVQFWLIEYQKTAGE